MLAPTIGGLHEKVVDVLGCFWIAQDVVVSSSNITREKKALFLSIFLVVHFQQNLSASQDVTSIEIENAFRLCSEVGINTVAYFMIGTPVERTRADVADTIRYSIQLDPDFVMFNLLTPFPGTTLFDEGLRDGVLDLEPWTQFMRHPDESFKAQVWDEHFTREELRELLEGAYRKFYWRPKFVLRNITQIRNSTDFKRKATAGLRLLTG